jgi:hypothetical protein
MTRHPAKTDKCTIPIERLPERRRDELIRPRRFQLACLSHDQSITIPSWAAFMTASVRVSASSFSRIAAT